MNKYGHFSFVIDDEYTYNNPAFQVPKTPILGTQAVPIYLLYFLVDFC